MNDMELIQQAQAISRELAALKGAQAQGQQNLLKHTATATASYNIPASSVAYFRTTFTPTAPNTIATAAAAITNISTNLMSFAFREVDDSNAAQSYIIAVANGDVVAHVANVAVTWFSNFAGAAGVAGA